MNYNIFDLNNDAISKILEDGYSIKIYSNNITIFKDLNSNIKCKNFNLKNDKLLNLFLSNNNNIYIEKNNGINVKLCNYYGEILYECYSNNIDNALNNIISWIKDNIFVSKYAIKKLNYIKNDRLRLSM